MVESASSEGSGIGVNEYARALSATILISAPSSIKSENSAAGVPSSVVNEVTILSLVWRCPITAPVVSYTEATAYFMGRPSRWCSTRAGGA